MHKFFFVMFSILISNFCIYTTTIGMPEHQIANTKCLFVILMATVISQIGLVWIRICICIG
jgi:hypothetical protein